jgi:beta-lactamase class A
MTSLTESVAHHLDRLQARSALCARRLASQEEIALHADEAVNPLSTIKIPLMVLAYRDADAGLLDLDDRYTLRAEDRRLGSGLLQYFAPGLQPTYRDLVTQMIITSDNSATDLMIARLGLPRVNRMLADLGYAETRLQTTTGDLFRRLWERADPACQGLSAGEVYARGFPTDAGALGRAVSFVGDPAEWLGRTTAREMARLLEQLVQGHLASPAATAAMVSTLQQQFYNTRLPRLIEDRVAIGHKTGDWGPIAGHDVGILFARGGPIVIALFISDNRGQFAELEAAHGSVAETILNQWEHHS